MGVSSLNAQGWLGKDLSNISAKELTNSQREELLRLAKRQGYNESDLEALARARGIELPGRSQGAAPLGMVDTTQRPTTPTQNENILQSTVAIYGQELFAQSSNSFAPTSTMAPSPTYVLGPNDKISLRVYGLQELNIESLVQSNGNATIPYAGEVSLVGLSMAEAEKLIAQRLRKAGYASLGTGQSHLRLSLAEMRSIQVLVWGAQKPGAYTLPSLATAFHALLASGGPGMNRSYRNIQIMRNGKAVRSIDLYEYLANGDRSSDINLQDNDIVFIPYYSTRVRLRGEVKTPAVYELLPDENLWNALNYAGGFTEIANRQQAEIIRYGAQEKEIYTLAISDLDSFSISGAEVLTIGSILDQFKGRIRVEGAVMRPGYYGSQPGQTLQEAIENAGGFSPTALQQTILVYSNPRNGNRAYRSYDWAELMKARVLVQENDEIFVADSQRLYDKEPVAVFGDVNSPGTYDYGSGLSVAALLMRAGGFNKGAKTNQVLVSRKVQDEHQLAMVQTLEASRDFWNNSALKEFILEPGDVVAVYHNPMKRDQVYVTCEGEFQVPGVYPVTFREQSLLDIYQMAGGANSYGNPENIFIVRTRRATIADAVSKEQKNSVLNEIYQNDSLSIEVKQNRTADSILVDTISLFYKNQSFLKAARSVTLMPGDRIVLPTVESTVRVTGAVYNPNLVMYNRRLRLKEYIGLSGGYSASAMKRKVFVVYSNGRSAQSDRKLGLIPVYPKIEPGCEIIVPVDNEWQNRENKLSTQERIAVYSVISTSLSSLVFLLVQLGK